MEQEEVALQFEKYDLTTAGVVDKEGKLLGMITVDDVMEVAREEFEEDVLLLGGVGEEVVSDSVWFAARNRFTWLLVNLFTAALASLVIGLFDATIEEMVALAVLMPIVASMGGAPSHPSWYLNLVADPNVTIQDRGEVHEMVARTADPDEKAELWPRAVAQWPDYEAYQERTERDIPLVVCEPR